MGEVKQYECPKCGYTTPVLHFGCGFRDYYEVYICKACQTIQSSLVATEDCMSEFDEESELDNVNLVTVYGEDYNNKELVEYSKREKAKKCNHCSSQVISEIPYQIEIDFQNLTDIDKRLPHMKYYLTFKDIVKMVRKGKKRIIHCNDCKEELEIYYIVSYGLDENYDENKIPDDIKNCIDSYDFKTLVELKLKKSIEQ